MRRGFILILLLLLTFPTVKAGLGSPQIILDTFNTTAGRFEVYELGSPQIILDTFNTTAGRFEVYELGSPQIVDTSSLNITTYTHTVSLGSPQISLDTEISPSSTLKWGDSATLTITVKETGGEDWANDVTVSVLAPQDSKISIIPSKSGPRDISRGSRATFTFTVRVPEYEEPGRKMITVIVSYGDTGWLDIGETRHRITEYVYLTVKKPLAKLIVQTTPSQASVYINNKYKGTTPIELTLVDGSYDSRIEKKGYETIQEVIALYPGKTTTITRTLNPLPVPVTINSNPSGATVYINGEYKGIAPLTIDLFPGTYTLKLTKNGYQDYATHITVKAGEPNTVNPTLSKIPIYSIVLGAGLGAVAIVIIGLLVNIHKKKKPKRDKRIDTKTKGLFPPELLKKYDPLEFIGEGGFAKVFKVKRKKDGKIVALKIPGIDEKTSKLFLREVSTWLHLDHPNIVKLYDIDILPIPQLEMEYVEGVKLNGKTIRSLEDYPKPVDEEVALRFVRGVTHAIKHAHSQNVLHRDIKPLNILLKHDFTPKLTDWGLSKIGVTTSSKSVTGYTPLYAAPEQLLPAKYGHTDHRTDLYQVGAVLYELLTGQPPYEGHSQAELIGEITDPNYLPKKPSEFNSELYMFDKFFERVLAKRKENRFQSGDEILQALDDITKIAKKRKELKETVAELKKSLKRSRLELRQSKSAEDERLKSLEILDLYQKLVMVYCELNSHSELLKILENLKYYVKDEELNKDIHCAIDYLKYYIAERLPISKEFTQKLNELLSHIKRKAKRDDA